MALNPPSATLARISLEAFRHETPFRHEADSALAAFRAAKQELERAVRRGDLTPKIARERAAEAARALKAGLAERAKDYSPVPRIFLDKLAAAAETRYRARRNAGLESLQRETNALLRRLVVEQQLVARTPEFEGRTYIRPIHGGRPAPTLDSLLTFHREADQAGDAAALEWTRRRLEAMRAQVVDPADHARIDAACDRPDRINPRSVERYVEALRGKPVEELERFLDEALAAEDAGACAAGYLLAREAPEGNAARWVRRTLDRLVEFPDAAITALRAWEAEARRVDAQAALSHADLAAGLAETEAKLPGVEAPSQAELERQARFAGKPLASPDEPIGLSLGKRGMSAEEFAAWSAAQTAPVDTGPSSHETA